MGFIFFSHLLVLFVGLALLLAVVIFDVAADGEFDVAVAVFVASERRRYAF